MLWWSLWRLTANNPEVRQQAVKKLGESKDKRAVVPLIKALKDIDGRVQEMAVKALIKLGDASAIEPLVMIIRDRDSNRRRNAARVLQSLEGKLKNDEQRALLAVALGEWQKAASLGAAAVNPLIEALKDNDRNLQEIAVKTLIRIGEAAVHPLVDALKERELSTPTTAILTVLRSLEGRLTGDERALLAVTFREWETIEPLITTLSQHRHDEKGRKAAEALGWLGDARTIEPLFAALLNGADFVGEAAAAALIKIGVLRLGNPLEVLIKLGNIAGRSPVSSINSLRRQLLNNLGNCGEPRAVGLLIALTNRTGDADLAVETLIKVLEKSAGEIGLDELHLLAHLFATKLLWKEHSCAGFDGVFYQPAGKEEVECFRVRQLARQEMIRRGVKA